MDRIADSGLENSRARAPTGSSALPFALTLALFVLSGATGLIDQLCFSKYLSYIVGSTAYAVSAVLAAFMTGLAIGAHFGGKFSPRVTRPLRAYGLLELVVALAVAATPFAFHALTPVYAELARKLPGSLLALSALRWLVALLVVIVPTTAMGATLPLLSRGFDSGEAGAEASALREKRLGALYAVNTLGGAAGALAAAYSILPALGVDGTVFASAAGSALIASLALAFGSRVSARVGVAPDSLALGQLEPSAAEARPLFVLAFASGALVFAAEVVFTHLLALIIGNSAYAFGLILAAFLSCLFLGASRASWAQRKFADASLPLGLALSGLGLALTLPAWDKLPYFFDNTGEVLTSFAAREAVRGVASFVMLVIPTTLMGLTFPLLLQRAARYAHVGLWVGRLTAVNTIGAVLGSLLMGYAILPWLGSQRSLIAIACVFALSALLVAGSVRARLRNAVFAAAALTALFAGLAPRWNLSVLTSGSNVYFDGYHVPDSIVMIREDVHGGVTTVADGDGVRTLYTNGKFQGNTGWEMNAQRFFAHYPSLFVKDYRDLLVIGLGTGTTLGTLAGYPWQKIDVAEISPSILYAARTYFKAANRGAIDDPRVAIHHADGRNFLLVEEQKYDLISMELSSIWFSGAASLYSKEFYGLVHQRMKPNAVFQQWVQLHHVLPHDLATILNTLRHEFSHVTLFYGGGQGILVASEAPLVTSRARLEMLEHTPRVAAMIPQKRPLVSLLDDVLVSDAGLDRFLADQAQAANEPLERMISTDTNLYLEYATPRGNVLPWSTREDLVADLRRYHDDSAVAAMLAP
ncbi:MAG TPA: fused MFS/spermidine synthase [Polyangiaceae bacterium]|nr:fused MFS/spermidine synthase [Polyangiaceae bacterium]